MRTKTLRRTEPTEADTLKAIVDYLEFHHILYLRHNTPSIRSDKHGKLEGFRKIQESQKGAPDLIVFPSIHPFRIHPIAIEVKAPKGRLSSYQENWCARAVGVGVTYVVVRSFEGFLEAIK